MYVLFIYVCFTLSDKLAPPQNLKAGNVEKTSLVLEWAKVNGATQYSVKQGQTVIAAPVGTTQTVKGLKGGMKYKFSVATENAAGVGAYSAVIEVTTEKYGMSLFLKGSTFDLMNYEKFKGNKFINAL